MVFPMPENEFHCPMAATLDLIGDRWSLVILRDIIAGKRRYQDFISSAEGIPTNILANRLKALEQRGLLTKRAYQDHPARYEYLLTKKGADLLPVLQQLSLWGLKHLPDTQSPPRSFYKLTSADVARKMEE